jgi:hypothetical protein
MAIFAKRGRMLLGRAAGTVMDAVTAPMNSRSRRNAEAAVASDRIRAGDREQAARAIPWDAGGDLAHPTVRPDEPVQRLDVQP